MNLEQIKNVVGILGIASVFVAVGAGTYKVALKSFRSPAGAFGCSILVFLVCLVLSLAYGVYVFVIKPLPPGSLEQSCKRPAYIQYRERAGRQWFECVRPKSAEMPSAETSRSPSKLRTDEPSPDHADHRGAAVAQQDHADRHGRQANH